MTPNEDLSRVSAPVPIGGTSLKRELSSQWPYPAKHIGSYLVLEAKQSQVG